MLLLLIAAVLLLLPTVTQADTKEVSDYVDKAVQAKRNISYEARMTYLSPFDQGLEQQVHIHHVAPELYRVVPLVGGSEGDTFYIENAVELTRIRNGYAEAMPVRQFYTNDNLTIKFLRDLGRHPGTTLLDGIVGGRTVYVLRQDISPSKPYTITVGLDQKNFFPVFLLVLDAEGMRRVYYEMDVIEYSAPKDIPDELFLLESKYKQMPSPRVKAYSAIPGQPSVDEAASLPLVPSPESLPEGYVLESISALDFKAGTGESQCRMVVFQLEIYGPRDDLLSVFQTRSPDFALVDQESFSNDQDAPYVLSTIDGWTVAAFGSLGIEQLEQIVNGLHIDRIQAERLLAESRLRESLLSGE